MEWHILNVFIFQENSQFFKYDVGCLDAFIWILGFVTFSHANRWDREKLLWDQALSFSLQ